MSETIAPNKVVAINYAVKTEDGQTLDQSKDGSPLNFIHGRGMLIPGLENALEGKKVGDSFTAEVKPEEAYGERHDGLIQTVPRNLFGENEVQPGMQFRASTDQGEQSVVIVEVKDDEVTVDGNHPLAGVNLNFDVEVIEVREATEQELEHGHVHTDGEDH
ncbi:peptidylprolyl isomerase [Idiomarina loihiensis]|jgi:FKBP-type peptidyl-prolyl cis-trans isomerase SlyD|uniref:Peptidyl-prolyl cis-trans isomerase n=2 Tax=Idiomarina TaxID=135575 RepID=A0A9X2FXY2_9GAMM|nr:MULTISPECIES: peptidylprolyl isomerase [Idiomarina]MAA61434.1 peptidylprolyl isomerase [Idiomarina sp.]NWO02603.1 peptidylprolyl isomerase [Idiomarinaceae bacterium]MBL4856262.1 peptidylprolyl isomerase [Idiomarina sp.]MCP1339625.1 peptidylprolyl isomerase [Idiomarina rhizosphaerae]MRJ43718.1 peptidylprolyl isomerase [Idiomarina loihiensis]|tara:strand:+ start:7979 stop:8461 length:483 start_codon:yes stop_codon:yes gene_type:complete